MIGEDHDYHACLSGRLELRHDPAQIDKHWNNVIAAWFEGGKDDPNLTMLALKLDDAAIWASTGNPLRFGWEIAKSNYDEEKTPDVGIRTSVRFS
ncbi:hypothetical protein A6302_02074 [Methylobrevis pamukkalensis]|uniref:General stress protein FMN-binding split barrel domain-containing protein n=1 Tax=Methylobrevis pamukkalensis TaxID=1439726 RepID=A0A1E3H493_9HYPH|nr:hypothetical protein A6302_02074 [Methylobrevis pamukkalensis]